MPRIAPLAVAVASLGCSSGAVAARHEVLQVAPACPSTMSVVTDTSWLPQAVVAAGNAGWNQRMVPGASWIWRDHSPNGTSACFSRRFAIPAGCSPSAASLVVGMDDRGEAKIDGQRVIEYSGWSAPSAPVEVAARLRPGEHVIELCASNWNAPSCNTEDCNPAGVIARLDIHLGSGKTVRRDQPPPPPPPPPDRERRVLEVERPRAPKCPSSFAEAQAIDGAPLCEADLHCRYPEGQCHCRARCSGVPPRPGEPMSFWTCGPHPARRTDGCSEEQPAPGSTCHHPGRTCRYGECCITTLTCNGGHWQMSAMQCPP